MALLIYNTGGSGILTARARHTPLPSPRAHLSVSFAPSHNSRRRGTHVARARRGLRRTEDRGKKGSITTAEEEKMAAAAAEEEEEEDGPVEGYAWPQPELPGDQPDFWEGPQWNALGFFVQYLWAFGIGFALIACGIAVATYNDGATDFKQTPVYKESVQSRELLEEPDSSDTAVFEANPTEDAPSLE